MRAYAGDQLVVDSRSPSILHEHGYLPVFYFPPDHVRTELLEPSDHVTTSPTKGTATYWHVRAGDRLVENAVWAYRDSGHRPDLSPYLAFSYTAMDRWLEEDREIVGHARDPYHRVDAVPSSRHVRISKDGTVLAESIRPVVIFEAGLPARWYLPLEDVKAALTPSDLRTNCTYKGRARYFTVEGPDGPMPNLAWTYDEPQPEVAPVAGLVCFFNEQLDVDVDGERESGLWSPWANPDWWRAQ
jgi:uncharacterized protein (DUF427 family)